MDEVDAFVSNLISYYENRGVGTPQSDNKKVKKLFDDIEEHVDDDEFPLLRYCDIIIKGKKFTETMYNDLEQYNPVRLTPLKFKSNLSELTEMFDSLYTPCKEQLNE